MPRSKHGRNPGEGVTYLKQPTSHRWHRHHKAWTTCWAQLSLVGTATFSLVWIQSLKELLLPPTYAKPQYSLSEIFCVGLHQIHVKICPFLQWIHENKSTCPTLPHTYYVAGILKHGAFLSFQEQKQRNSFLCLQFLSTWALSALVVLSKYFLLLFFHASFNRCF